MIKIFLLNLVHFNRNEMNISNTLLYLYEHGTGINASLHLNFLNSKLGQIFSTL